LAGGVMSAVSQTAVVNEPEEEDWPLKKFIKDSDDSPH